MTDRLVYRVPEVCAMLGISRATLYNLVKAGKITVHKLGSMTLVKHAELERLIKALPSGPAPDLAVDKDGRNETH